MKFPLGTINENLTGGVEGCTKGAPFFKKGHSLFGTVCAAEVPRIQIEVKPLCIPSLLSYFLAPCTPLCPPSLGTTPVSYLNKTLLFSGSSPGKRL